MLLRSGPHQRKPVLLPSDKNLIFKKCNKTALLPQHVEMQCEKRIKPPTHKREKRRSDSDGTGKAHAQLSEILQRAAGEGEEKTLTQKS